MSILTTWFKCLVLKHSFRKTVWSSIAGSHVRGYVDKPDANSKQIMVQGTESEVRVRVRRTRPADVPRVLRFVRDHARSAWPGLAAPPSEPQLVLCDYVARALSQGHSMLAEQQEMRRGGNQIRGLALGVSVCPWDATILERWARCVRCARGRRLVAFTAHCLRAPALHDKYRVHNILQVILIVPQDNKKRAEIISLLAKNAIKRGHEIGFPLIRFDVTCNDMAKTLEELDVKKEWQLSYDVLPQDAKDSDEGKISLEETKNTAYNHRIAVYTAKTNVGTVANLKNL